MGICFSKDSKVTDADWFEVPKLAPLPTIPKAKPHKLAKSETRPDISKIVTAKKLLKAVTTRSLDDTSSDDPIVTAWVVNGSGWEIAYDDDHNIYYYTDDGKSSWDPPQVILNDEDWQSFASNITVKVPHDTLGGQVFTSSVGNVFVDVLNPVGSLPGGALLLLVPIASDNEGAVIPDAVIDISTVDASVVWADLSTCADLDYGEISDDVAIAHTVLEEIANGSYKNDLIFQLSWAYKIHLLETAVKDCYVRKGDYFNSERYDNCNGIPRYADRGLVDWWQDLRSARISIEEKLSSISESLRLFGNTDIDGLFHSRNVMDMDVFETSSKDEQLAQLVERRDVLTNDLDNMTAQMLAIVSIDGGPSTECVETVHDYLKDVLDRDLVIEDNRDEIDEFVSNALEPRHKFTVNTILNMVLLEQQIEALEKEIAAHKRPATHKGEAAAAVVAVSEETSAADDVKALIARQEADARSLEAALLADQAAKRAALQDRLAKSRQNRIKEKMAQNPSLTEDVASALVDDAIREEERVESEKIDKDVTAQLNGLHSSQLSELKKAADVAGSNLKKNLENEKQKCIRDLRRRLEEQKAARKEEILSSASGSGEETELAIEQAIATIEEEASVEKLELEDLFVGKESEGRREILTTLRAQHDVESERLKTNLSDQQEARKRALASRLERKVNARASTLVSEAAVHGEQLTLQQATHLAGGELEEEKAAEEAAIESATKERLAVERSAIVDSLKEYYDKESANMQTLMTHQEGLHKSNLQERLALKKRQKQAEVRIESLATGSHVDAEAKVNGEMARVEAELKERCDASLLAMKANYESVSEVLQEELASKGKKYSESLAQRLQKRNQLKAKTLSSSLSTPSLKQKLTNILSIPEVSEPKEHTQMVNDIVANIKRDQDKAIVRLKKLITSEKEHEFAELAKMKGATSATKASLLLNFSSLLENSAVGLKKRNLYLVKSIKEYASNKENDKIFLTDSEYAQLTSAEAIQKVCQEASEQLLTRIGRDISGICDCHATEDNSLHAKMVEDCTPATQMHDAEYRKIDTNKDQVVSELRKGTSTLVGIWVNVSNLMENGEAGSPKAPSPSSWGDGDELEDEEACSNYPLTVAIKKWIHGVCSTLKMCDDSVCNLYLNLNSSHFKSLGIDAIADKVKLHESSLDYCRNTLKLIVPMAASTFYAKLIANDFIATDYRKLLSAEYNKNGASLTEVLTKDSNATDEIKAKIMHFFQEAIKDFLNTPIMQEGEEKKFVKQLNVTINKLNGKSGNAHTEIKKRHEQLLKGLDEKLKKKKHDLKERLKRKQVEQMKKSSNQSFAVNPNAEDVKAIEEELKSLVAAQETVRKIVVFASKDDKSKTLESISVEILLLSVDKILKGGKVQSPEDFMAVQQESLQVKEAQQVGKIREQQAQSDEKLDLALKMKQAKDKQLLQKRLMNKKVKA